MSENVVTTANPNDKKFLYYGRHFCFVGVTETSTELDPIPVHLATSGNDPKGVLKDIFDPRPVEEAEGVFFKINDLLEPRETAKEPITNICNQVTSWRFKYDPSKPISGKLLYADDPDIKRHLRTAGNDVSTEEATFFTINEEVEKPFTNLLVVRKNIIRRQNLYEVHYYPKVYIEPASEPATKNNVVTTDLNIFPAYSGSTYGYMIGWYVRLGQDGTNTLVNEGQLKTLIYGG